MRTEVIRPRHNLIGSDSFPVDWNVKRLGDVVEFLDGKRRPVKDSDRAKMQGDYPYYGASGIVDYVNDFIFDEELILLGEDGENILSRKNKLAFRVSGKIWVNNHAHVLKPKPGVDIDFLAGYLEIISYTQYNTGTAQPKLNKSVCANIPVLLPPIGEQHSIATALKDMDELIRTLDQLIIKKKNIKQGAMQALLNGKKRLEGFNRSWETKSFEQLFRFLNTANNPWADLSEFGDVGYIHYGNIHTIASTFLNCSIVDLPRIAQSRVANIPFIKDGDLVMADASEDYSGIGKCVEIGHTAGRKIVAGLHTFLLRGDKEQLADGFKGYLQFIPTVKASLVRLATGISVYGISKNNVKRIEVLLPGIEEQSAIAQVLSDMDSEIEELEKQRDKYLMIKKGMMQKLLTGEIRLQ